MARIDNLTNFLTDVANAIKEKKGDTTPIQASNFDTEIINLPSGSGDIYHVATIEEMNAISKPKKNDYCLVLLKEMSVINATDSYTKLYFPDEVVLDTPLTDWLDMRLNDENWTVDVSIMGEPSESLVRIRIYDSNQGSDIEIQYTTTDNLIYTLATPENQNIILSAPVRVEYEYNEVAAKFIYGLILNFGGIYQYIENAWIYASIGADTKSCNVYDGNVVYTDNGIITGTMTKLDNNTNFKNFFNILYVYDSSGVTDMHEAFMNYDKDEILMLNRLNTSNVTDMSNMFWGCNILNLDLSNFNTSKVTDMQGMFSYCGNLTNVNVSSFDTSNVTDMSNMFFGCTNLLELDVSSFNTSNVTDMTNMFNNGQKLTHLDVSSFDTSNVTDMRGMFGVCYLLESLDLSNFDTSKATGTYSLSGMFSACDKLANLKFKIVNSNCDVSSCPLTVESVSYLLQNLGSNVSGRTLTLGTKNLPKATQEDLASATAKGWTIN